MRGPVTDLALDWRFGSVGPLMQRETVLIASDVGTFLAFQRFKFMFDFLVPFKVVLEACMIITFGSITSQNLV